VKFEAPNEHAAEERAWEIVRAAYAEREPVAWPRRHVRPLVATAVVAAAVAAVLSPPGRSVVHSLRKAVGVQHPQTELFSLPAPGRLLVSGPKGTWIVNQDGSRRRLGSYRDAAWSPHGLFVVATRKDELVALDPKGNVRWALPRRSPRFPAWTGTRADTRIAYLSGGRLHVVAGDGTGDRAVARAGSYPPSWLPRREVLFSTGSGLAVYDPGSGETRRLQSSQHVDDPAVQRSAGQSEVFFHDRVVFRGTGVFDKVVQSPDRRWLLVSWPTANQWVFVRLRPRKIVGVARIAQQFGRDARIEDWCCAH
jgi:hypothetical protein